MTPAMNGAKGRRQRVLEEIFTTEDTYVRNIETLLQVRFSSKNKWPPIQKANALPYFGVEHLSLFWVCRFTCSLCSMTARPATPRWAVCVCCRVPTSSRP